MEIVDLHFGPEDLEPLLNGLKATDGALETAVMRALNKSVVSLRAEAVRHVRTSFNVKAKDVRANMMLSKATKNNLRATIRGEGSPGIPLIAFRTGSRRVPSTFWSGSSPHKKASGSVKVHVSKARGVRTLSYSFAAKMPSGHVGIFGRKRGEKMRKRKKEAIKELYGPSAEAILAGEKTQDALSDVADELMEKNLRHEAEYLMKTLG